MQALQCFKCFTAKKILFSEAAAGATQIATNKLATTLARFTGWKFGKASPLPVDYICNRPLKSYHLATLVRPLSATMAAKSGPSIRKRVNSDAGIDMKRAPDGSAFFTCESCKMQIPIATADMHDCQGLAGLEANLAIMRAEKEENLREGQAAKQGKKSKAVKEPKSGKAEKKVKDPNEPKRPVSSYFIFMETFRKTFKEENPDAVGVVEVTKAAGAKWKEMTAEEKKPYLEEQEKRKVEYDAKMEKYLGKI